jgi:hypothetical protein
LIFTLNSVSDFVVPPQITKAGHIRIDRGAIREAAKYDGKCVLETNDDTISLEDAACGYKSLMVIQVTELMGNRSCDLCGLCALRGKIQ